MNTIYEAYVPRRPLTYLSAFEYCRISRSGAWLLLPTIVHESRTTIKHQFTKVKLKADGYSRQLRIRLQKQH